MARVGFYFDMTSCMGCRACQVACKDKNDLPVGKLFRQVDSYLVGSYPDVSGYNFAHTCNHCDDPICLQNCPTGAISKADDGTVVQDTSLCVGCRMCVMSCPYDVPVFFEDEGVSRKCDGCIELRNNGEQPACVAACPMRALEFGDFDELAAAHPDAVQDIAVLPDSSLTSPSVLIGAKDAAFDEEPAKALI